MSDATTSVQTLRDAMRRFVADRAWEPFHSPKNLVMGLAVEAAELMEHFLWVDIGQSRTMAQDAATRVAIGEEMADVACYLFALANATGIDLSDVVFDKLRKNEQKYPAERYRGRYRVEEAGEEGPSQRPTTP
jgi:NTP pyrophosphatase (non-canonical NTP hydrolase)